MRTDDEEFFAAVCRLAGREPPPMTKRKPSTVAAAMMSKGKLAVVSLRFDIRHPSEGQIGAFRTFHLQDRSAGAIQVMARDISSFSKQQKIDSLYLRALCADGKYPGHALSYKVEAVLQLGTALQLTFVSDGSVRPWVRSWAPELPHLPAGLGSEELKLHRGAIETALFVAENLGQRRYFWDGRQRNG